MNYKLILLMEKGKQLSSPLLSPALKTYRKLLSKKFVAPESQRKAEVFIKRRVDKGLNNISMLREVAGFDLRDKTILELGTGGHGIDLLIFYALGGQACYTVDVRCQLDTSMLRSLPVIENRLQEFMDYFGIDMDEVYGRLEKLKSLETLEEILATMQVTFIRFSDFAQQAPGDEAIDLLYSESNLQRIPKRRIAALLDSVKPTLRRDACGFYRIDCRDIHIQRNRKIHDPNLWRLEYLKFSDWMWRLMTTEKFGSQNRLRACQFIELSERMVDCRLQYMETYTYAGDNERVAQLPLAAPFRGLPAEDVAVSHARMIVRRQLAEHATAYVKPFAVIGDGVCYPPPVWNAEQGLLVGEGLDD